MFSKLRVNSSQVEQNLTLSFISRFWPQMTIWGDRPIGQQIRFSRRLKGKYQRCVAAFDTLLPLPNESNDGKRHRKPQRNKRQIIRRLNILNQRYTDTLMEIITNSRKTVIYYFSIPFEKCQLVKLFRTRGFLLGVFKYHALNYFRQLFPFTIFCWLRKNFTLTKLLWDSNRGKELP